MLIKARVAMICIVSIVAIIILFTSLAAHPQNFQRTITKLSKSSHHKTLRTNNYQTGLNDETETKIPCGPVIFPDFSCEDLETTLRDDIYKSELGITKILGGDRSPATTTKPPTTPTSASLPQRMSRIYRGNVRGGNNMNMGKGPYPYRMNIYRQFRSASLELTSSTRPYGWEIIPSTVSPAYLAVCPDVAKCENQYW